MKLANVTSVPLPEESSEAGSVDFCCCSLSSVTFYRMKRKLMASSEEWG